MDADIAVRPPLARLPALMRGANIIYVIDAGRVGFPAGVVARVARRPVVFELGDPQGALFRVQGRSRAEVFAGETIDRAVARAATGVAVRGRRLAELLHIRVPWIELPDGVDLEQFRPANDPSFRAGLGIPEDVLVAGLVGTIGPSRRHGLGYGWDLVEALAELGDKSVVGLVVGDGPGLEALRARARQLGLGERVLFPGRVPHDDVPRFVNALDVCVSTQTNDAVGQARTTAKLPEYLACDRYVLATAVGAAGDVLPAEMLIPYSGSWDPVYPRRLAERLAALAPRRSELRVGAGTRPIAAALYAYPVLAERLAAFLLNLAG